MNIAEQIYQNVQDFTEALALEVFDFVVFLKLKNQPLIHQELDQIIQQGINEADISLGVSLDDDYIDSINERVQQRLTAS